MDANDVVVHLAKPLRPMLPYAGLHLGQLRVVVLPVEAARVIDEDDMILHRMGKNMLQFCEDWRIVKRFRRFPSRIVGIEPEEAGFLHQGEHFAECLRTVTVEQMNVGKRGEQLPRPGMQGVAQLDGVDFAKGRPRGSHHIAPISTRLDQYLQVVFSAMRQHAPLFH